MVGAIFDFSGKAADELRTLTRDMNLESPAETTRHALRLLSFLASETAAGNTVLLEDCSGVSRKVDFGPLNAVAAKAHPSFD